jgi:hypothetical protein
MPGLAGTFCPPRNTLITSKRTASHTPHVVSGSPYTPSFGNPGWMHVALRFDLEYQVLMTLCIPALTAPLMLGLLWLAAWGLTFPDLLQLVLFRNATHSVKKVICHSLASHIAEYSVR